jgi:hypothetical protein
MENKAPMSIDPRVLSRVALLSGVPSAPCDIWNLKSSQFPPTEIIWARKETTRLLVGTAETTPTSIYSRIREESRNPGKTLRISFIIILYFTTSPSVINVPL